MSANRPHTVTYTWLLLLPARRFRPLAPSGPAPAGIASAQQAGRAAAAAASSPAGPASVSSGGGGIIGDEAAEWVAVKLFPRLGQLVPEQLEYLRREVVCMMRLEHPHVVAFKEVGGAVGGACGAVGGACGNWGRICATARCFRCTRTVPACVAWLVQLPARFHTARLYRAGSRIRRPIASLS